MRGQHKHTILLPHTPAVIQCSVLIGNSAATATQTPKHPHDPKRHTSQGVKVQQEQQEHRHCLLSQYSLLQYNILYLLL